MFAQEPAQMNLAGGQIDSLALHKGDHKLQSKADSGRPLVKNNDATHFHSHIVSDAFCTLESQVD